MMIFISNGRRIASVVKIKAWLPYKLLNSRNRGFTWGTFVVCPVDKNCGYQLACGHSTHSDELPLEFVSHSIP